MTAPDVGAVAALVKDRCGLNFDGDGNRALAAALGKRMSAVGIASAGAYAARLSTDAGEFGELVNLLTINETYFYREPDHLDLIVRRLGAMLSRRAGGGPIRILSAGCSTGEEPYSVVMALKEAFGDGAAAFSVLGIDIDSDALAKARDGRYWDLSFRSIPPPIKDRYFTADPTGGSRVVKGVRTAVTFQRVNLLADDDAIGEARFDAILFRNVSIYFDTPTRRRIVARFADMLADQGCLIVGASETLSNDFGLLRLVEEDGVFYFVVGDRRPPPTATGPARDRKTPTRKPVRPAASRLPTVAIPPPPKPVVAPPLQELADAARLVREKRYDESLAILDRLPAGADASRLRAQILFNRGQIEAAEHEALQVVASQPWCTDSLILLGQLARLRQDHQGAIRWLKQAVYARPDAWLAHYCLAEAYRQVGSAAQARREYGVVVQQLSSGGARGGGTTLFPLAVAPEDLRRLCQRHLADLDTAR